MRKGKVVAFPQKARRLKYEADQFDVIGNRVARVYNKLQAGVPMEVILDDLKSIMAQCYLHGVELSD